MYVEVSSRVKKRGLHDRPICSSINQSNLFASNSQLVRRGFDCDCLQQSGQRGKVVVGLKTPLFYLIDLGRRDL